VSRVAVTGASGLIGSALVAALHERGDEVVRLVRRPVRTDDEVRWDPASRHLDPAALDGVDAVVSIACSVGPQYVAARYPYLRVFPGLNTTSIGGATEHGVWKEFCQACGNCIIGNFGGLCPVTRCAKQLMNGPCGGSSQGICEVGKGSIPCIWQLIYDRLKNLGELHKLTEVQLYKNWSTSRDGGLRTTIREELKQ